MEVFSKYYTTNSLRKFTIKSKVQFTVKSKNSERCNTMTRRKNVNRWQSGGKVVILRAITCSGNQSNIFPAKHLPQSGKMAEKSVSWYSNLKRNMEITTKILRAVWNLPYLSVFLVLQLVLI